MPRVKLFSKEEAYKRAMELFWQKGYTSTSLSDLTAHLEIGKGSFYATFNSKRDLFNACFDLYRNKNTALLKQLLDSEPNVKVGLEKLLEFNLEQLLCVDKRKGCFIANSCSEIHGKNDDLLEKLVRHYQNVEQVLASYLKRGNISPQRAESISAMVVTYLIGMSQQSKINRDRKSYLGSISHLVGLLDQAKTEK